MLDRKHGAMAFIVLLFVLLLAAYVYTNVDVSDAPIEQNKYKFIAVPCWFDADWTADIRCGELHTPAESGAFRLPVVILADETTARRRDAILYLQGGPGAGAGLHAEGIKSWLSWMRYAALGRDLILIDTRGTGRSSPALVCAEYNQTNQQMLRENISLTQELATGFAIARRCFDAATARNPALDYRHFSTQQSARDIRALMGLLDYREWNILGVSYGTRLALEISRQETLLPQTNRLKAMVLDSIYPAGFGGVQTWPQVLDEALHKFFTGCDAMPECKRALGVSADSTALLFMSALARLREAPIELTIRRWDGEAPVNFLLNDHRFLSAAFAATYTPHDWLTIASAIHAVAERDSKELKPLIEPFVNRSMSGDFNSLTFTAVDCADNPVLNEQDYLDGVNRYPLMQRYTRDQWRYQLCHHLATQNPLQRQRPAVPSLILAGEFDPITPLVWAQSVHAEWGSTQLHISKNVAHSVLGTNACLLQALVYFYDTPDDDFKGCLE